MESVKSHSRSSRRQRSVLAEPSHSGDNHRDAGNRCQIVPAVLSIGFADFGHRDASIHVTPSTRVAGAQPLMVRRESTSHV